MKTASREVVYRTHSPENKPSLLVEQGEVFRVQTELNGGKWLQSITDRWDPTKSQGPNLSVCVEVAGAKPGEVLAVEVLDISVENIGYTGFAGWRLGLCQEILPNDWDVVTKTVAIEDGYVLWSDELKIPVSPMVGTLGTAPAQGEVSNALAHKHGGNMDVQEVCAGTTIYLPVNVPGALLHIGDVHAVMGDGEINNGGGIECRGEVTLRVRCLPRPKSMEWLRMENEQYLMTVACENDTKASFCAATRELIRWMEEEYGMEQQEAYLLLGQVLEARCTVFVSPMYSYICKIDKRYLPKKR